jgi:DNA-binding NtrC family response regulator
VTGRPKLLIIDDEVPILKLVERFADGLGFSVVQYHNGREAIASLHNLKPDVALVDLRMPEVGGLDVLREIRAVEPDCQVILMTGYASVDTAIEAVKLGALDYLSKPFDFDRLRELLLTVKKTIERREQLLSVEADLAHRFKFHGMIGRSPAMQELFDAIRRLAPHLRTVLITGETGTGKELVARALHEVGPRRTRRLVTVNCSAVVENLFESELFGHVRGAFTGATDTKPGMLEHADHGTLFLDEIGELPLALQAKLLRAVENGEVQRVGSVEARNVDVSFIAATNRDLRAEASAGRFRSDLFYRLSTIEIHLVPLRERRDDIPYLTAAFVGECAKRYKRPLTGVTPATERLLNEAAWPGNVRELRNVIERACLLSEGRLLSEREVQSALSAQQRSVPPVTSPEPAPAQAARAPARNPVPLSAAGREEIVRVLNQVEGNKSEAARVLGLSRRALYRRLDRFASESGGQS